MSSIDVPKSQTSMKKLLAAVLGWFAAPRGGGGAAARTPEHERRLRTLQEAGRVVFLP
jgi:hypothetical protein